MTAKVGAAASDSQPAMLAPRMMSAGPLTTPRES